MTHSSWLRNANLRHDKQFEKHWCTLSASWLSGRVGGSAKHYLICRPTLEASHEPVTLYQHIWSSSLALAFFSYARVLEDEGTAFLRNVGNSLPSDASFYGRMAQWHNEEFRFASGTYTKIFLVENGTTILWHNLHCRQLLLLTVTTTNFDCNIHNTN